MVDATVLVLLGSLRAGSVNRRLAEAAIAAAPAGVRVRLSAPLDTLPHYNEDDDTDELRPAPVTAFYEELRGADAVLAVTPEYNGTMSSVLKNAIDWGSRPSRRGPLVGKPAAVIGATFGQHGGVWSQDEARRALTIAGANVVEASRVAIGSAHERFAQTAPTDDPDLRQQLTDVLQAVTRRP